MILSAFCLIFSQGVWSVSACKLVSTSRTNTASKGTPFCIMKGPPAKSFHVLSVRKSFLDPTKWNSTWNKLTRAILRPITWVKTAKIGPKRHQKKNCRLPPCLSIHSEACQIQQIWRARFQASKKAAVDAKHPKNWVFKIKRDARVIGLKKAILFKKEPNTYVSTDNVWNGDTRYRNRGIWIFPHFLTFVKFNLNFPPLGKFAPG